MRHIRIAVQWLFILLFTGMPALSLGAEKNKTARTKPPQSDKTQQEKTRPDLRPTSNENRDIWREVSFDVAEDLLLTKKQVDQALHELKKTDPSKAEQIEKLKDSDAEAFFEAIRDEIERQKDASKKPPPQKDKQLEKKYQDFLGWFEKKHPKDHSELTALKTTDSEKFVQRTKDLFNIYRPILKMEKVNPDLAAVMEKNIELQKQRDALLLRIRISETKEKAKLIDELKSVVSKRFDTIVRERQLQYEWQGRRIEELTQKLQERTAALDALKKSKNQSVEARLEELVKLTKEVNWN